MTDAEKIEEITALISEVEEVINANDHPNGIPGTILATNVDLLAMVDMAHRQIAALINQAGA